MLQHGLNALPGHQPRMTWIEQLKLKEIYKQSYLVYLNKLL